jgi:long-chain acyl-CoA synthetase
MTADPRVARVWAQYDELLAAGVQTIPQLLLHQAARHKGRVLHRRKDYGIWQRYTWDDVVSRVRDIAMGLAALGVERGQTVAIVGENEPELFWCEYAALCIGAKVVCLYPDLTAAQMEYMLQHSEAVAVLCEDQEQVDKALELEPKLPLLGTIAYWDARGMWKYAHPKLLTLESVGQKGRAYLAQNLTAFERAVAAGNGNDIAVLSYTSGTTGNPKACILTHHYLLEAPARIIGALDFKPFTQYLSYISPAWATEQFFGLAIALVVPFIVNFPEEPETVQDNIREIGAEALMLSPRQWESLYTHVEAKMMDAGFIRRGFFRAGMAVGKRVNLARLDGKGRGPLSRLAAQIADLAVLRHLRDNLGLQSARVAVSGGSGMAPEVFRFFHAMGVPLRNIYGSTEVGLLTAHQGQAYDLETVGSWLQVHPKLGTPLETKVSEDGELLVRGGVGFAGYYNNAEATAKKLADGWYRTEDAVHLTDKGELVYLDRIEDMRRLSSGHRYPPQFIENRLRFSPFIKDAMTLGDDTKPFVAALININAVTLGRWAEQNGVAFTTFADLSQNARILELIARELRHVNALLPEGSRIRRFVDFPKELDPDEDELTRTRKLRRKYLEQKYASFIDAIYGGKSQVTAEIPVKYQDGRIGRLNAVVQVVDVEPAAPVTAAAGTTAATGKLSAAHG